MIQFFQSARILRVAAIASALSACTSAEVHDGEEVGEDALTTPTPTTTGITREGMSGSYAQLQYDAFGRPQVLHRRWQEPTSHYASTVAVRWSILDGNKWTTETLDAQGTAVFAIDANGRPYVAVMGGSSFQTGLTVYTRTDDGLWNGEGIAVADHGEGAPTPSVTMGAPGMAFDDDGTLHVAYQVTRFIAGSTMRTDLVHAWKVVGAAWQSEVVGAPSSPPGSLTAQILVARDGTIHIAYPDYTTYMHAQGRTGGPWTMEALPTRGPIVALLNRSDRFVVAGCDDKGVALWSSTAGGYAREAVPLKPALGSGCALGATYDSWGRPHVVLGGPSEAFDYAVKERNVWKSYWTGRPWEAGKNPSLAVRNRGGLQVGIAHSNANQLMFTSLAF